ncbi:response regulator transcription factor [Streptomyces sp. NPDC048281]|uniref:response regulator transcription factor n=1 Tax=Streptomyces sp. NPDC048281 TaxID=3154715 RepID=UPI0034354405
MRRGVRSLLASHPLLDLVASVADPEQLDVTGGVVDVIVLGPNPRTGRSLDEVIHELAEQGRVLLYADFTNRQSVTDALRAGAYGCVSRQSDDDGLLHAVGTVLRGGIHVAPELARRLHTELHEPSAATSSLTLAPRETEALRLLAAGLTHGQIARRMELAEATISTYIKRIRSKLGVGNKADLTRKAIELGLLQESSQDDDSTDAPGTGFDRPVRGQAGEHRSA